MVSAGIQSKELLSDGFILYSKESYKIWKLEGQIHLSEVNMLIKCVLCLCSFAVSLWDLFQVWGSFSVSVIIQACVAGLW